MSEAKDGGASRLWPKAEEVKIGEKTVQIVPITLEDMEGWETILSETLEELKDKTSVSEAEFFKVLLHPKRMKRVMEFIIIRPRADEKNRKINVNEVSPFEIRNITLPEAFTVVEALGRMTDLWSMLGKARGLWDQVKELTEAAPNPAAQKSRSI